MTYSFEILKRGNFRCTDSSVGVETQLSNLAAITQVIDPKLHQHLGIAHRLVFYMPLQLYEIFTLEEVFSSDDCQEWWST